MKCYHPMTHWEVLSTLGRMLLSIVDLNILMHGITRYVCFELEKNQIDDSGSDMLTKALPKGKFEACGLNTFSST